MFLALVIVVLVFTIIGILLAVPLFVVAYVVRAFGSTIAFLAVADRLLDREEDDWLVPLLVAAGTNGALVLTDAGGVPAFRFGAAGFSAVMRAWLE